MKPCQLCNTIEEHGVATVHSLCCDQHSGRLCNHRGPAWTNTNPCTLHSDQLLYSPAPHCMAVSYQQPCMLFHNRSNGGVLSDASPFLVLSTNKVEPFAAHLMYFFAFGGSSSQDRAPEMSCRQPGSCS